MLLYIMETAHEGSQKLFEKYRGNKKDNGYRQTQRQDFDYEKDILLDEDVDDYNAFDYED